MSRLIVAFAFAWLFSVQASAALVYELTFSQTNVSAGVGQSLTFDILFRETATTGGDPHRLDLAGGSNGLLNANFTVNNNGLGGGVITSLVGNNLFDVPAVTGLDPSVTVVQDIGFFLDPVFASLETPVTGGTMRSVQVGSLTVMASNVVGESNLFQLADFNLGSDDFVIDDGFGGLNFAADSDSVMSFGSVNVTAVPEPSSLVLLGIAGLIGGNRLRRLRKVSEPKNVSPTTAS